MLVLLFLHTYIQVATAVVVDYANINTPEGNRLPDFSYCGYHSGNVDLPPIDVTPTATLSATDGDQSDRVQQALNELSSTGGGVLLLSQGNYAFESSITIPHGTVLRGSGRDKTVLLPQFSTSDFIFLGPGAGAPTVNPVSNVTDEYVPIGATTLNVFNSSKFHVGQQVVIQRAVTEAWVRANGMADLERDGNAQRWISVSAQQEQKLL